uniref:Uncharacterized protein n=1 Tax=Anopheles epiroticus TaxID=199890 RepID=A0A182PTD0_9DIPT
MPFSRQYGSFRMSTTTGNSSTGGGATCSPTNGNHRIGQASTRNSSVTESASAASRLQMAPLGYRAGNLARNASNNWISNISSGSTTSTTTFAAIRQQKISSQQEHAGRPGTTTVGKPSTDRCAVHRGAGGAASSIKKQGEPIGDSPLLQSPCIIARSARIVEPNAWNRRLTTSSFCTVSGSTTQPTGNRFLQVPLPCRKSPASSGTSVESIVPKYTPRTVAPANGSIAESSTTTAQKRTYNAHKPQLRVVSSRVHTNTTGRVGGGGATVAKKASTTAHEAEREVAKVLHHHNMRVIDLLNNNHLHGRAGGRTVKENNENHQPVPVSVNGGHKQPQPATPGNKKGTAIPQRLPLADREHPTDRTNKRLLAGECFSNKFPNGLPFEQEFYYRRQGTESAQPLSDQEVEVDDKKEGDKEHENVERPNGHLIADAYERLLKTKKHALLPKRHETAVMLAGRRVAMTNQQVHRSRSVSSSSPTPHSPTEADRRSVSTIEREHDLEDALYVDFTKVHDPHAIEQQQKGEEGVGGPQTSVVEYRNINHSSYYYKFESISSHQKHRKSMQGQDDGTHETRSRFQRSRLGLNRTGTGKPDGNGNGGHEYYDDDEEQLCDYDQGEEDEDVEEESERSTVYVAVATWVPKCNRLPNETSENNNSICLTLAATNGNSGEDIEHQHQQQQPTRIAVTAAKSTFAAAAVPPPSRKGLPVPAPTRYGQL